MRDAFKLTCYGLRYYNTPCQLRKTRSHAEDPSTSGSRPNRFQAGMDGEWGVERPTAREEERENEQYLAKVD
jgi:hypothetical protein